MSDYENGTVYGKYIKIKKELMASGNVLIISMIQ